MKYSLCDGWEFSESWSEAFGRGEGEAASVRIPHTAKAMPTHYGDSNAYQMICGYRTKLHIGEEYSGKKLFLQFDGAGHIATVYVNGQELEQHAGGYTAFRVDITDYVAVGEDALIAVRLDTTENPALPPFGFVVDYLTYGGLYREVWLDVREQSYIGDIFVTTPTEGTVHVEAETVGSNTCRVEILQEDETVVQVREGQAPMDLHLTDVRLWSPEDPYRYTLRYTLLDERHQSADVQEVKFGIRFPEFRNDGFYLNGKKTFLRGLNRHQCFPHMGYAAPERLQREDARILKEELGCVAVRTSHYPQSQYFIDECDRLGLMVFTEVPGWQHIGDEGWKKRLCRNTEEMILQYRNHPSIVLWGVRVNESADDDALYRRTNAIAHQLDPSRPTSGVRCILKSSLMEDVYAYNDFSHMGSNPGVRLKKDVTPNMGRPLLVSEHTGHIFPTKSYDTWTRRQEHALRHARVQNAAASSGEHCGCFGWCMFDYPTHKDFGSGDRICYHGVMDFHRNPKLAAALYASQQDSTPVLTVGSSMAIGDYPNGLMGDISVFTNADTVALYKNDDFVTNLTPSDWKGLPHAPMAMDDMVGCMLETKEHFPPKQAGEIRALLLEAGKVGMDMLTKKDRSRITKVMRRYKMTFADFNTLFGKYIGNWGGEATVWRFDGLKDGKVVSSVTVSPSASLHLEVRVSSLQLQERDTYDMAAVRIRVLDENGNPAPYAQIPVCFQLKGCAELVGPAVATAEGGMCGTYIRTTGKSGKASLTITTAQTEPVVLSFTVK